MLIRPSVALDQQTSVEVSNLKPRRRLFGLAGHVPVREGQDAVALKEEGT
jgi:hypothetical protein